uniref:Zinc transporter ZIP9 n=1 Tax=Panagrolaimus sp. JU765 TaxID=591449 RepID=A0AC34Q078_9BILA
MEDLSLLLVLCGTMFVGSYAAGFLPLAFTFSENKIRLLSILGAGLLVGTALSVIIPEGVEALQGVPHHHSHVQKLSVHQENHKAQKILEETANAQNEDHQPRIVPKDASMNANVPMNINAHGDPKEPETKKQKRDVEAHAEFDSETGNQIHLENEEEAVQVGPKIGYSLILGFLLMLLVDQLTKQKQTGRQKITATVGLVVHAAVDGIALGSASMTDKSDIQLIVFVAIMLHKAPAAFGLSTILLMEGLEKSKVKKHLFVFSASAPIGALITFFLVPKTTESVDSSTTGVMLLFSAGTFLYVATVHVLPELAETARKTRNDHVLLPTTPGTPTPHSHSGGADFNATELVVLIIGSILPSILSAGHHH